MYKTILYIISISCQLAGAIILLFGSLSTNRPEVIKRFSKIGLVFVDENTGEVSNDTDAFTDEFQKAFLNRSAFLLLAIGYLFGIWGEEGSICKCCITLLVILITALIAGSIWLISKRFAKNKGEKKITKEEIEKIGAISIRNLSNNEIDNIINKNGDEGKNNRS